MRFWKNTKIRTGFYLLPLFALLVVIFIQLLPQTLTVLASNDSLARIISPPEMTSYWLTESFDRFNASFWKESHKFRGVHFVDVDSSHAQISFFSDQPVLEDEYQITPNQSWPIDELQALQLSFKIASVDDSKAKVKLEVKIENTENEALAMICQAQPLEDAGYVQCFIQDKDKKAALSNAIPFTLGEWHTLTMAFVPDRFSIQFFLDDHFYGEIEIPSVEYWRERDFAIVLGSSVSNLDGSSYSALLDNVLLSHQP